MGRTRLFLSMFNCRKPLYFKGFRRAKFQAESMRNEAKFVSHISFIGFRKQVAGRVCQEKCSESAKKFVEKCGDSAKKFMEKCILYLDFSVDLCYDNTIENYGRMKNAPT